MTEEKVNLLNLVTLTKVSGDESTVNSNNERRVKMCCVAQTKKYIMYD